MDDGGRGVQDPVSAGDADMTVRRVLSALDLAGARVAPLGDGLASDAWRVDEEERWSVLRIARGGPRAGSTYEAEHALMRLLAGAGAGARVPRPIVGDWEIEQWSGPAFSLTTGLDGRPLAEAHHRRAAPGLAAFLRMLHAHAIEGFGPLEVVDGSLRGTQSGVAAGLTAWAGRPLWPLAGATLDEHAALGDRAIRDEHPAPGDRAALRARLDATASAILGALDRGPAVLLHADLHEGNILDADGALGIIDFGQAVIGPAAWEFAALAYFLGWPMADATIDAYARDDAGRARLRAEATAMALCFGVHRWAQDRALGIDEDAYDGGFLVETLARR